MAQYSVIIVDGDPDYIQYLAGTLKANGFDASGTSSGADALNLYKRRGPDLVIADLNIAELDGLALLEALRDFDPKSKVILTCSSATKDLIARAFRLGALDVLEKPLDIQFLIHKVQELLVREDRALEGNLTMMSLASIIQINCEERNQAELILNYQGRQGAIFFQDGEMVHAESGNLSGEEAVYDLLGWENGTFQLKMGAQPGRKTIHKPWSGILLEGMRRIDESTAGWSPDWDGEEEGSQDSRDDIAPRVIKSLSGIREVTGALICDLAGNPLAQDTQDDGELLVGLGGLIKDKAELVGGYLEAGSLQRAVLSSADQRIYLQRQGDHLVLLTLTKRSSADTISESVETIYKRYQ